MGRRRGQPRAHAIIKLPRVGVGRTDGRHLDLYKDLALRGAGYRGRVHPKGCMSRRTCRSTTHRPHVSRCSDVMRARWVTMRCPGDDEPGLTAGDATMGRASAASSTRFRSRPTRVTLARDSACLLALFQHLATDCGRMHLLPCVKGLSGRSRSAPLGRKQGKEQRDPAPSRMSPQL